jgi:nucleoid-associated protein YgaU
VPIRGTATVTLKEIAAEPAKQNPTSGGRAARRSHLLVSGDTLASVAYAEYGDPALWRVLAEANGVDDPMRLSPGVTLLVPAADEIPGGRRAGRAAVRGDVPGGGRRAAAAR